MSPRWRFGLLGENIQYTKSPAIFEAIGNNLGESIQFDVHDVASARVPIILESMKRGELDGLSVTIPHKETVMPLVDRMSDDAQQIGAVNSIGRSGCILEGHNTDWAGFCVPLLAMKEKLKGKPVLIFGTGGAARACMYALRVHFEVGEFTIVSRSMSRRAIVERAIGRTQAVIFAMERKEEWLAAMRKSVLIVNATPLGGGNVPDGGELLSVMAGCRDGIYYDLNYNHNNELTDAASKVGAVVIDGKWMLVAQAVASMRLWTGVIVSFEAILKAVFPSAARRLW